MSTTKKYPNILFVCYEDTSPRFGAYGDPLAQTPVFDRIANEGCRFDQCFGNSPVCAPSRSSVFTGMYPTAIHCQNMRTSHTNKELPEMVTPYVAVPPPHAKCFTEYLRAHGYYCTAQGKPDFQFMHGNRDFPFTAFDAIIKPMETNSKDGLDAQEPDPAWRRRPNGVPFFAYYNLDATHESGMWNREDRLDPRTDPAKVSVPPHFPDTPEVRKSIARQYDNLVKDDGELGHLVRYLEEDGILDDTVIIIWADHGEGMPRAKRMLYNHGLHLPLVIRYPKAIPAQSSVGTLVSNIDIAPTLFSLIGLPIPAHFHGKIIAGPSAESPTHSFACRDRMGEGNGRLRSIRDNQFTYIQNSFPCQESYPWEQYRNIHPAMQELFRLQAEGALPAASQAAFFSLSVPEELYDRSTDRWELNNLAHLPEHRERLVAFRNLQREFERDYEPFAHLSEEQLKTFQTTRTTAPATTAPRLFALGEHTNGRHSVQHRDRIPGPVLLQLSCPTHGASQVYHIERLDPATFPNENWAPDEGPVTVNVAWQPSPYSRHNISWKLYTGTLRLTAGVYLVQTKALRYGYRESAENHLVFAVM